MSRWSPKALLVPVLSLQPQIDQAFFQAREQLLARFPTARVHHVGSTALAPALSRGLIDIDLVVPDEDMESTRKELDELANEIESALPISVELHSSAVPSPRLKLRQALAEHPLLLGEYIGLQKLYAHVVGKKYGLAKAAFMNSLMGSQEYAEVDVSNCLPYRIELETERLCLSSSLVLDAEEIADFRLANRAHIERSGGKRPDETFTADYMRKQLARDAIGRWRKSDLKLLVRTKSDNSLIGICNFSGFVWGAFRTCNLGYLVGKEAEGKGYMSEACAVALDYIYTEWGVHRVQAMYVADNTRSAALARRLGLRIEGKPKDYIRLDGRWHDGVVAGLVR